ncbi:MAG TPA: hypothetical protein VEV87_09255, partial [Chitinophagaceae bacterium]|nr:hypothetical protein [Chitinophagaceae bacterium]
MQQTYAKPEISLNGNTALPPELDYLYKLIQYSIARFSSEGAQEAEPEMPGLQHWQLPIKDFIRQFGLSRIESQLLLVAIAPHVQPDLFDAAIESSLKGSGDFPKIGGVRGKNFRGFLPTGQTVLFLVGADNWKSSQEVIQLFWSDHLFARKKILWLEDL